MKIIDFDTLEYPSLDSKPNKEISFAKGLYFQGELFNKSIKIDEELQVLGGDKEKKSILFLEKFVKETEARYYELKRGSYFLYKFKKPPRYRFEGQDRLRLFLTAVRIYKNTKCESRIHFSLEGKRFFRPFILPHREGIYRINESIINSRKELNIIKKIFQRLKAAKCEENSYYSKIFNAVKFFNHSYDEHWTLLKTTLAYTALESLFSDSEKTEVIYKISLRTAYFLHPKDHIQREKVFRFIKYGYDIRSYFVHGSDVQRQVNKVMKKIGKEKNKPEYSFHFDFVADLREILSKCLTRALLDKNSFNFFTGIKIPPEQERDFYDSLVLS